MKIKQIFALFAAFFAAIPAFADDFPTCSPIAEYTDTARVVQMKEAGSTISEQAPLTVLFRANPSNLDGYAARYKWSVYENTDSTAYIVRYDEDFELEFTKAGTHRVQLLSTFIDMNNLQIEEESAPFTITISESKLEFPNAFSPNGDGRNDIYRVKAYQSIVDFKATIYNRWGQKVYTWNHPSGGWDGTINGSPAKQGVYFVEATAKGADGKKYHIRRDVNLLRGYTEAASSGTE